MKISYQFLSDCQALLKSSDWKKELNSRIEEINTIMITSEQEYIEQKLAQISNMHKPKQDNEELVTKNITNQVQKWLKNITIEKTELEYCLNNNMYKLGFGPFKDIDNARLLLANSAILEYQLPYQQFNPDAVLAVKNMLKANFKTLYDEKHKVEIEQFIEDTYKHYWMCTKGHLVINKLIHNEPITYSDMLYPESEQINEQEQNQFKNLKFINPAIIEKIIEKLEFIMSFYPSVNSDQLLVYAAINLALCFNSTDGIEHFFANLDYSSAHNIDNICDNFSIDMVDLSSLSKDEISIWRTINDQFGVELFNLACDIKINYKIDVRDIEKRCNGDYKQILEELKAITNNVQTTDPKYLKLAEYSKIYHYNKQTFDKIINQILPNVKHYDNLPDIAFTVQKNNKEQYHFSKLPINDIRTFFVGKMTHCCQFIGGDSEQCVIDAFTRPDAGIYIVTDANGKIKAQSYAWISKNKLGEKILVLDSFEHLPEASKMFVPIMKQLFIELQKGDCKELYVGSGGNTPKINNHVQYEVKPESDLYQHNDSKYCYKITNDMHLNELKQTRTTSYNDLDEMLQMSASVARNVLFNKYETQIKKLDDETIQVLSGCSIIVRDLLKNNIMSFEQAIELVSKQFIERDVGFYKINLNLFLWNNKNIDPHIKCELIGKILQSNHNNIESTYQTLHKMNMEQIMKLKQFDADSNKIIEESNKAIDHLDQTEIVGDHHQELDNG